MNNLSYFNPIKRYEDFNLILALKDMLKYESEKICFYGDNNCYFYSPLRRVLEPNVSFTDERYFILFSFLKADITFMQKLFRSYSETWSINLISHFENRLINAKFSHTMAYYTFVLSLYSKNISGEFSNYIKKEDGRLFLSLRDMIKFNFRNDIYHNEIPENQLLVSFGHDLGVDGLLITKKRTKYPLLREVGAYKFYEMRGTT